MDWAAAKSAVGPLGRRALWIYLGCGFAHVCWNIFRRGREMLRMARVLKDVPQMRCRCGLGATLDMLKSWRWIHDWRDLTTRGLPVSKVIALGSAMVATRDPEVIKHILKDKFDVYSKPSDEHSSVTLYFKKWLGDGIFTAPHGLSSTDGGHNWQVQRKIASHIFKRKIFNELMTEVFVVKAARMQECLQQAADEGKSIDIQDMFFNFTMDSVMKIFFGQDSDILGGQPNEYGRAFDDAHYNFVEYAMHAVPFNLISKFALPWPFGGNDGLIWKLHARMSPTYRKFLSCNAVLDRLSASMVNQCRADPLLHERRDLLALFIQAEERERFSTQFLRDVVLSFVIAGRDTTACTLSWMFYILATHADIQRKLSSEVDSCEGLTLDSITPSKMPFLNGVIHETLRLYPPVPFELKECGQDDVLPGGYRVPKGANVSFLPYAMGRDPDIYTDPLLVKPERWMPFTPPSPYEFPVFQAGPRICLGKDMAIFEAKIAAISLLKKYTFTMAPGEAEKITYGRKLTMTVCNDKGQKEESEHLWLIPRHR